jgi:protein-disulfide isomerase
VGVVAGVLVGVSLFQADGKPSGVVVDVRGAPALGPDGATVTLIEYSDYECPYCIRHTRETMPQIVDAYITTGRIRYVFKDWPVDQLHPDAIRAHEAGHCAAEQGKFWETHRRLFGPPGTHTPEILERLAGDTGLDVAAFRECIASGRTRKAIRDWGREAQSLGATGTPAFFLGHRDPATERVSVIQAIPGAQPFSVFAQTIDSLLK